LHPDHAMQQKSTQQYFLDRPRQSVPQTWFCVLVLIQSVLGVIAAVKFHLGWNCIWTSAICNRCHWFQVQSNITTCTHKFAAFDAESGIPNTWRSHFARNNWLCFLL
jgi:nitrate/TMAO reductase-like tetraheme cytochrome c subunit